MMVPKDRLKVLVRRLVVMLLLFGIAALIHRIGAYFNQEILGAVIFILLFSIAILHYYFSLFKRKHIYKGDYFLGIAFIFFLTVIMFAIIYAEPIEDGKNYFLEYGVPQNLTLPDAIYFSTTTITTLGMGDITPHGVFRYMVMIEVVLGLLYAGSMVYFITRELEER